MEIKKPGEVQEVEELANKILVHWCNNRCKIRIGDGDSDANFQCYKIHAVKGTTDPTNHAYIPVVTKYQQETLKLLLQIGFYNNSAFTHYFLIQNIT